MPRACGSVSLPCGAFRRGSAGASSRSSTRGPPPWRGPGASPPCTRLRKPASSRRCGGSWTPAGRGTSPHATSSASPPWTMRCRAAAARRLKPSGISLTMCASSARRRRPLAAGPTWRCRGRPPKSPRLRQTRWAPSGCCGLQSPMCCRWAGRTSPGPTTSRRCTWRLGRAVRRLCRFSSRLGPVPASSSLTTGAGGPSTMRGDARTRRTSCAFSSGTPGGPMPHVPLAIGSPPISEARGPLTSGLAPQLSAECWMFRPRLVF
mmetsp:Transcript_57854/g.167822  ORF Transcript_57854/g.167822 Transcript_57854/m.167822 type:complete len:263 (+) Transcript_57854:1698-2486(+)